MSRSFHNDEHDDKEVFNKFTYVCPECEAGLVRMPKHGNNEAYWICLNSSCGTVFRDCRGKPIGNPVHIQDDNDDDPFR